MDPLTIVMIYQQDSPGTAAGWQETRQGLPGQASTRPFGGSPLQRCVKHGWSDIHQDDVRWGEGVIF
jgi:hypothetical protein